MSEQKYIKGEKFKSDNEALKWVRVGKPFYHFNSLYTIKRDDYYDSVTEFREFLGNYCKAIPRSEQPPQESSEVKNLTPNNNIIQTQKSSEIENTDLLKISNRFLKLEERLNKLEGKAKCPNGIDIAPPWEKYEDDIEELRRLVNDHIKNLESKNKIEWMSEEKFLDWYFYEFSDCYSKRDIALSVYKFVQEQVEKQLKKE